jgi:hypothetical protein
MLVHEPRPQLRSLPLSATRRARTRCARPAPEIAPLHAADRKPAAAAADDSLPDSGEDPPLTSRSSSATPRTTAQSLRLGAAVSAGSRATAAIARAKRRSRLDAGHPSAVRAHRRGATRGCRTDVVAFGGPSRVAPEGLAPGQTCPGRTRTGGQRAARVGRLERRAAQQFTPMCEQMSRRERASPPVFSWGPRC